MGVLDDILGHPGEVNDASTERAIKAAIDGAGLNPEQVADRIEWAIRDAYIRGTGDGYAKGVQEFALIWPISKNVESR